MMSGQVLFAASDPETFSLAISCSRTAARVRLLRPKKTTRWRGRALGAETEITLRGPEERAAACA